MLKNSLSYLKKYFTKAFIDFGLLLLSFPLAFLIRLDWPLNINQVSSDIIEIFVIVIFTKFLAVCMFRPFTATWRQISFYDVKSIFFTVIGSTFLWTFFVFLFYQDKVPRSIPILDIILSIAFLFSIRFIRRYVYELNLSISSRLVRKNQTTRTLVIGGGQAAALLLREIRKHPEIGIEPVAILDDDLSKVGQKLSNVPIKGPINEIAKWVEALGVEEIIIAVANNNQGLHRRAISLTSQITRPLRFRTIPALVDIISGEVKIDRIREVDVSDLLGRENIVLEEQSINDLVLNQVVLITGAGGSIGSELVRQVAKFSPRKIVLLGRGENSLYTIDKEVRAKFPELEFDLRLCDVRNVSRLDSVFQHCRPNIVLHAAAHKHVPLIERNPEEAVFNNILGTKNIAEICQRYNVSTFVNISTDKAVNPTSVMGASKQIAEAIVFNKAQKVFDASYVSVRFGNVLGSRGSVIPLFQSQIEAGGPVTVTHPDMIRYIMTIPEAAQLVLQAAAFQKNGMLYVLDMGEPVKIYDLARDIIRLSGFQEGKDIEICFSGMRPGEKLYEELSMDSENRIRTYHHKIFEVEKAPIDGLSELVDELVSLATSGESSKIRKLLNRKLEGAQIEPEKLSI